MLSLFSNIFRHRSFVDDYLFRTGESINENIDNYFSWAFFTFIFILRFLIIISFAYSVLFFSFSLFRYFIQVFEVVATYPRRIFLICPRTSVIFRRRSRAAEVVRRIHERAAADGPGYPGRPGPLWPPVRALAGSPGLTLATGPRREFSVPVPAPRNPAGGHTRRARTGPAGTARPCPLVGDFPVSPPLRENWSGHALQGGGGLAWAASPRRSPGRALAGSSRFALGRRDFLDPVPAPRELVGVHTRGGLPAGLVGFCCAFRPPSGFRGGGPFPCSP